MLDCFFAHGCRDQTEHRSPRQMREHYADYFMCPNVMAVLGVSFWETTKRAAAILWTRQVAGGPPAVAQAVDFGIAPLTDHPAAGVHFDDTTLLGLPAVPQGMWVRFVVKFIMSRVIFMFKQMELYCSCSTRSQNTSLHTTGWPAISDDYHPQCMHHPPSQLRSRPTPCEQHGD